MQEVCLLHHKLAEDRLLCHQCGFSGYREYRQIWVTLGSCPGWRLDLGDANAQNGRSHIYLTIPMMSPSAKTKMAACCKNVLIHV